ncbi:MAG: hypothetical protein LBR76_07300 [Oscillospiraceae bacterium]|nr:hypothetical protein [Oscillospiraceae bacterium]
MMIQCPVCEQYEFEEDFELCPICEWQHDRVQENEPNLAGGANRKSLDNYRLWWQTQKKATT